MFSALFFVEKYVCLCLWFMHTIAVEFARVCGWLFLFFVHLCLCVMVCCDERRESRKELGEEGSDV